MITHQLTAGTTAYELRMDYGTIYELDKRGQWGPLLNIIGAVMKLAGKASAAEPGEKWTPTADDVIALSTVFGPATLIDLTAAVLGACGHDVAGRDLAALATGNDLGNWMAAFAALYTLSVPGKTDPKLPGE
jgi:hypothetical protein